MQCWTRSLACCLADRESAALRLSTASSDLGGSWSLLHVQVVVSGTAAMEGHFDVLQGNASLGCNDLERSSTPSGSSWTGHRRIGSLRSRRMFQSRNPLKLLREPVIHRLSELVRGRISSMGCPSMQCVSARLHQRSDGAPSMACQARPALLLVVPTGASAGSRLEFVR